MPTCYACGLTFDGPKAQQLDDNGAAVVYYHFDCVPAQVKAEPANAGNPVFCASVDAAEAGKRGQDLIDAIFEAKEN